MKNREIIIDGYNLMHKLYPAVKRQTLESCRRKMETLLIQYQRKNRCMMTVVYDGGNVRESSSSCTPLCTIFTATATSADTWIIDYVKSLNTNRKMVTIVSSDREVCLYGKAYGAKCLDSVEFVTMLYSKSSPSGKLSTPGSRKYGTGFLESSEVEEWKRLFEKGGS